MTMIKARWPKRLQAGVLGLSLILLAGMTPRGSARGEPHLLPAETAALEQALGEFQRGDDEHNRAMREHGLTQVLRMGHVLHDHGVELHFDISAAPADVMVQLRALKRPVWSPGKHRIKEILSACFLVANMACGYNWQDPAESNVTGIEKIETPAHVSRGFGFGGGLAPAH